jgi:helix-turn-helix protein
MAQVRNEIYDENGLIRIEHIEVNEPTQEELIAQKESELLEMYEELQKLKEK